MKADEIWMRLSAEGLVQGARPEPAAPASPWFVRLMLGIAGWIGAMFLLGFVGVGLGSAMRDGLPFMLAGAACCGAALALFRSVEGHDFAEQFALALSLAGQALVAIGIGEDFGSGGVAQYLAIAFVEIALVWAVSAFLHRMLATCGAAVALAFAMDQAGLGALTGAALCGSVATVWLDQVKWTTGGRLWRPVGYGLVLAVLLAETVRTIGGDDLLGHAAAAGWTKGPLLGRVLTTLVLGWVAVSLALREELPSGYRPLLFATTAIVLLGALSVSAPGLATAVVVLLLGFAAGNRVLMISGVIGLLGSSIHFYYSLHATLLVKSGVLAITGVCLLAASLFLRWAAVGSEGAPNA